MLIPFGLETRTRTWVLRHDFDLGSLVLSREYGPLWVRLVRVGDGESRPRPFMVTAES